MDTYFEETGNFSGHYHFMVRSVLDLFAEVLSESKLFNVKDMQLLKLEPRNTDINLV